MNVLGHHLNDKQIGMALGTLTIIYFILKWILKIIWYAILGYFGVKIYKDITRP